MTALPDKEQIKEEIIKKLRRRVGVTPDEATKEDIYQAASRTVRDLIMDKWADALKEVHRRGAKRLYYLSAEFLMGRALTNNMINLDLYDAYRDALAELGFDLGEIEEQEFDAGLGNGGLGRLAACFLDSLSTLEMPVTGCCIRYEHGLFRQRIVNGEQQEADDNWIEKGNIWEIARPDDKVEVRYGGHIEEVWTEHGLSVAHEGYTSVLAYPYDMPVIGYESKMPATLRMWEARAKTELDMSYFNKGDYARAAMESALVESISQVLYPEDNHEQGRLLRLKQFYFFTSASMQFLVRSHKKNHGDVHTLPDYFTIQINDTHPTLAIPELIRILLDDEGLSWDEAFAIAFQMFNYTNHTIMREALERWNENMLQGLLPRIHKIITVIDQRFRDNIWGKWPGDWNKMNEMSIIYGGEVRMANLCIAACGKVNGVSQLHANIIRTQTFRDFYILFPDKFLGVTNGITTRRWLAKSNRALTAEIEARIGRHFLKDYTEFEKLRDWLGDPEFCAAADAVKRANKERFAAYLKAKQGAEIDPGTIFDVQAKRLHEYKRQLLKILHVLCLYYRIKAGPSLQIPPTTFLFAAKAAPGYYMAKEIIRLINAVAEFIDNDPSMKGVLKVVFIADYSVSVAEMLIPATDVSEQLSTAGLEASGTGNMKFMLNGAVTIGTMDGANVEIYEAVGADDIFIFGATAPELDTLRRFGAYDPGALYEDNPELRRVLDALISGALPVHNGKQFHDLYNALLHGGCGKADKYFVLHDFASYDKVFSNLLAAYADRDRWTRMSAKNTICSGIFSSDRTIHEYSDRIWHLQAMG
ncbi:MAG: glycogen/starch/alpha-glucan phosphorylase [Clostridiales Family XIII bacterium]|jgi:starch phosphorylase|nr:glycogen/starch/alpha-glucan phosphorylase [Clostridiales Family XIII bacterium]